MHPFAQFIHSVYSDLFGDHAPKQAPMVSNLPPQYQQALHQQMLNPLPQQPQGGAAYNAPQPALQQINAATGFRPPQVQAPYNPQPALNAINQSTGFNPYAPQQQGFNPALLNQINQASGFRPPR